MKLSFNKQPVTDNTQLNLFKTDFKNGDYVYMPNLGKYGCIRGIDFDNPDMFSIETYTPSQIYLPSIFISVNALNMEKATIEQITDTNWKINDICAFNYYGKEHSFFMKIWGVIAGNKPKFFANDPDNMSIPNSYYDNVYILRK